jgi:DNA repair protein RecO
MMPLPHEEECLILKPLDFREKDRILTFLAATQGKHSGVLFGAKSIRSKNLGVSEPFVLARIQFSERLRSEMVRIHHAEVIRSHIGLRRNYQALLHASYCAELALLSEIPPQDAPVCFRILLEVIERLEAGSPPEEAKLVFELNFLKMLGVLPDFERCGVCDRTVGKASGASGGQTVPEMLHQLDARLGGVRCPQCVTRHSDVAPLAPGTLRFVQARVQLSGSNGVRPTRSNLRELDRALFTYLRSHLGREPKSHALLTNQR